MNIISARGEKNLTEIARRAFHITGARGSSVERAAVAALARANPHLVPDQPVDAGTPIFVPPLDRADAPAPAAGALDDVKSATAQLREALDRIGKELDGALSSEARNDAEMLETLKAHARELAGARDEDPSRLKQIEAAAKARKKEMTEQAKEQRTAFARIGKDLDAFLGTL